MTRMRPFARLVMIAGLSQIAAATLWTATEIYVETQIFMPYGCDDSSVPTRPPCTGTRTGSPMLVTHTSLLPDITPISTTTAYSASWDLEVVKYYYLNDAYPTSDLETYVDPYGRPSPTWLLDVTFTAPTSCPTRFEYTTAVPLEYYAYVPSALTRLMSSKASVETHVVTHTREDYRYVGQTYSYYTTTSYATQTTLHVKPTDLPPLRRPQAEDLGYHEVNYNYIRHCFLPGEEDPRVRAANCPYTYAGKCSKTQPWLVALAVLLPTIFLVGFVENYFWFTRLMQGKGCFRCGTVAWCFLIYLFMVFLMTYEHKRSPEDQERLRLLWKGMPLGMRLKLWLKWGFRQKYPEHLLGSRRPVSTHEGMEMREGGNGGGGGGGAAGGGRARGGAGDLDGDMLLPAYHGPPSTIGDAHSMESGTTAAHQGPVLGNPNAVLGPVLGSGSVVIGPTMTSVHQTPASPRRQETDERTEDGVIRAV
ncbi:hypothetical protein QBC41DRAFT_287209 [Cercophora samala]|uniref:Uncharacterized protein n=1 Tax=Cercophora samala TaxID=330535 RepID=A0AA39YV78_9PEZI|nr:hypothetical protein QBC41DRAFT_287209 [Cercophora samala]